MRVLLRKGWGSLVEASGRLSEPLGFTGLVSSSPRLVCGHSVAFPLQVTSLVTLKSDLKHQPSLSFNPAMVLKVKVLSMRERSSTYQVTNKV